MDEAPRYRSELKYSIDWAEYLSLRQRLSAVMRPDPHAGEDGRYLIRSVYFDNFADKALREKMDGAAIREKFRLRYYNDDLSYITLEKKMKRNDLCLKLDAPITRSECSALLAGDTDWMRDAPAPLVRELYVKMKTQQLRPRVRTSYTREPYIYAPGNVRVTFDLDVRTSLFSQDFLDPEAQDVAVGDAPGRMILEVKFDEYLPDIIRLLLQTGSARQQAYSKYCACRKFG